MRNLREIASEVLIEAVTADASLNLAKTALAVRVSAPIEEIQKPAIENLARVVKNKFDDKPRRTGSKEGFKKPEFAGEKRARVVKKSSEDK